MAQTEIEVRPARPTDAETIATFNVQMAAETESLWLDPPTVEAGVRAVFEDASRGTYFVAENADAVVGCLLITHEWSDWRNGDLWWIQSVYVHPDHRGRGAFKSLYRHAEMSARAAGARGLRLYVDDHNTGAQTAYVRLGMKMSAYRVMETMF